jgi:DNA repair exonuclease SbcCD nuclease subunit
MLKVLHSADWHVRDKDIEEVEKCLNFLVDTARKEKVDLAIIAADIFDSRDIKLDSLSAKLVIYKTSELADICPVYIITGTPSHEGTATDILRLIKGAYSIHVATMPEQLPYCVNGPQAVITLIPTPTKQYFQTKSDIATSDEEISSAMNALFAGFGAQASVFDVPHILVGHWNVRGSKLPNGLVRTGMDIEISTDQMMLANPTIGCLGHIHIAQKLGDRFFFSGPIYATKIDEVGPNGFWIHEIESNSETIGHKYETKSRFIETPCKIIVRFTFDLTDEFSEHLSLNDRLLKEHYDEHVNGAYVRIDVTTWQDKACEIDKEAIKEFCLSAGALDVEIRINTVPRETIRAAAVLEAETLKDEFSEMARLRGEDIDPETLSMAEQLETVPAEELLKTIAEAA